MASFRTAKLEPLHKPETALEMSISLAPSLTLAKGTVLGQVTAPGKFGVYADAGAGGLDTARCILAYDCITDASSNIPLGDTAGAAANGFTQTSVPAYFSGIFKTTELTGLTAAA